nr:DUF5979 domain-containing protein [Clostridiales bacterium]
MKYKARKLIAVLMIWVMVFNIIPVSSVADPGDSHEFSQSLDQSAFNQRGATPGYTVQVIIDQTLSYDKPLYLVFKNVEWTEADQWNQFYSTKHAVQQLTLSDPDTTYSSTGRDYYTRDRQGDAESHTVFLATGPDWRGYAVDGELLTNNPDACKYYRDGDTIGNDKTVSITASGDNYIIRIGSAEPVPYTASVSGITSSDPLDAGAYCVVARVGNAYYYAPIGADGSVGSFADGAGYNEDHLPDRAVADSVKVVEYDSSMTPQQLAGKAHCSRLNAAGGEQYRLSACTPDDTAHNYGFTATPAGGDSVIITIRNTGTSALALESVQYYLVAGWNDGVDSYQAVRLDGSHPEGTYSFAIDLPSGKSWDNLFVIIKSYPLGDTSDPRDNSHGTLVIAHPEKVLNAVSNPNTITDGQDQYRFTLSDRAEENGKQKYTIDIQKIERAKHTAVVTIPDGVSTDNLYVVFRQPIANSNEKAYCAVRVTGSGEYDSTSTLINPNYGTQAFSADAETEVVLITTGNNPDTSAWMFQNTNFNTNNGLTVYRPGDAYLGNSDNTVTIIPDSAEPDKKTSVSIGAVSFTARIDFYDAWNVPHTDPVSFTPVTVSASNGTDAFSGTVSSSGEFLTEYELPANLDSWTFSSDDLGGYILSGNTPAKEGTVYVFEAHKPDTYNVEIRYLEAWGGTEVQDVSFAAAGTITAEAGGQTFTGTINTDGSATMDPVPAITTWTINTDNTIEGYVFKPSDTVGQENPSIDSGTHTYILTLREARTYRVEIEYYDSWNRGKISGDVAVGSGYTIEATDAAGTVHTGTVDPDTGAAVFDHMLPEITGWTVKHNGAAEDPQMIGGFRAVFDSTNPSETSRFDPALNDAAGYYVIAVTKPNTYSAGLSFYAADAEDPLDSVTLPETYVIMATAAEDGAVLTGTVGTDGQITWENNVTELPKISEFRFFKADGTTAVTRFGDYVLGVESYEDDDLRATAGAYQIIGRAAKLYPSTIEYLPENTAGLNAYYYLVASVEGVRTAYAAVTAATSRLTFIPFGAASSLLHLRMYRAESGGSASATGIRLPEDATFELIRSDAELDAAGVYSAAAAPALIDDYTLELTPVIEQMHDGSGTITEDTLVFKAQKMWTGDTIRISTYDYNGTTLLAPDTNFGSDYFLRVCIRRQSDNGIEGWTLIPLDQWKQSGQGDTAEIKVTRFTQLGQYPLNLADNSDAWKDFNSSTHYIEVDTDEYPARVVKITDKNQLDWYKSTNPTFVNDDPPEGYKYTKGSQEADGYRIRLKKAKPVEYRVRLDFDTADTTKINLDGGLYVKVTIGHQSSQDTYGWVRVDNANFKKSPYMTVENGHTYIDVPVTEWKNANGDIINGEKYKGTEDNIKVELVGAAAQYGNQPTPGGSAPMKVGSYVNNAEVTAYPTVTEGKDRITDDTAADKTVITDIVTLKLEPDSFDGYSLEYILNGYNIVTLCPNTVASPSNSGESAFGDGDFLMKNHCMGGVLIRGDIIHITGTGVADSEYITKPSVVGGYVPASSGPFINNRENNNNNWNAYVGSVNTVEGETVNGVTASGSPSKPRPDGSIRGYTGSAGHTAAYGDTYVDWDRLQQTVLDDSDSMAAAGRTIDNIRYTDEWGNPIREVHIDVTLGDNVTVNYPEGVKLIVNIIAPEGLDIQNSKNIPSTIINNTGTGTYIAPKVTVNGKDMSTVEDGSGMSLVWNYPKAARVDLTTEVTPFFGHIVAPRSYINVEGGNYSGCMVGNKVSSAGEGHLYPYNGGKLVITDVGFEASKAIDDLPADPDKLFYFNLEELDRDGKLDNRAGEWVLLEMVRNKSEKIEFAQIEYQNAGTYYYRISEYQHSVSSDIRMDTTQYIVKSVVTPVVSGTTTTLVAAQTYYRVPDGVTDYIESYTENEETRYRIDESALTPLSVPEGASGAEIAAQYLTFNNTSNSNSGITVRKTLTGETLSDGQFTFTIEKKSGPDASVGTVNEDKLTSPAANNDAGVVSFGKLSFTLADGQNSGVWVYTVKEVQPDPIPAGYVYDQSEYEITFTVTRSEGTLNVAKACRKVKNADGTDADEAVDGINFTNRRELGSLTISKTVVSPVPAEATQAFRFTVTLQLNGKALSGKYGAYTFDANGQATITVAGGSSVTIPDLPTGTTYTVVEAAETGFTTGHGTGSGWTDGNTESGTIASAGNTAAFRNTRETGGLSISKTVVSPFGADAGKTFTFAVVLSDRTISGTFSGTVMPGSEACDVVFLDGEASVTVAGGHTLTVEGLPTGVTWTVTEATDDNFSAAQAELSGTISAALSEAAFTNTRKTGDLQVGKQVTGTSDKTKTFTFTVTLKNGTTPFGGGTYAVNVDHVSGDQKTQFEHTDAQNNTVYTITFGNDGTASFDLKADEYVTISGLPVGLSYTVAETTATLPGGYEISSAETAAGSISTTAAVETFVNNYRLATTSVGFGGIKHIEGTDSTEKVFTFELYETDDTYDITGKTPRETVSTEGLIGTAGQDYTFSTITYDANMLTGTPKAGDFYYVIKEQALDQAEGWTIDGNKYRIHVHVQDDTQGHLSKTVTVTAEDASGAVTASTATAGTLDFTNSYTASGNVIFGAKKTMTGGKLADHPVDVRVTLVDGRNSDTPVCENGTQTPVYRKTATLALNSDIQYVGFDAFSFVKETGRDDTEHEYWFLIEEVLPAGVTPQDPVDHTTGIRYDTTQKWIKVTVSDEGDGRLTAVKDPAPAATTPVDLDIELTNEQLGGVQVTKVFSGHAAPAGFAVTAEYQLAGQNLTALQLTIDGANDTVAASGSGTENDPYLWTIEDLPLDTVVTFTESGMTVDGYAVTTSFNGTAGETGGTAAAAVKDGQGQYPAGALVNTYTRETGKMKIAKTATVNGSEQKAKDTRLIDGTYVFTVTGSGLAAGTSVTVCLTITGGVVADAEITQRTNASAVIISRTTGELSNLPTGEYTVTEDLTQGNHPAGVTLTASPAGTITVAADQTAGIPTAAFTNNREVGDLQISKSVTGTTDKSKDFEFTVVLTKPADADLEAAYPVTATAGVRSNNTGLFDADDKLLLSDGNANQKTFTIKLRADESITVLNLPAGTEYTVTEVTPLPGGYEKTEPSGDPNGLIGRDLSEAAFINNYTLNTTAVGFGGVKSIEGTNSTATQFAFELYQADNNRFNITGKTAIQTVTTTGTIWRTAGKSFNFEAITYSGDDLELNTSVTPNRKEKHFYYVIREKAFSEANGWTICGDEYEADVFVWDNGDGTLAKTVTLYKNGTQADDISSGAMPFINTYEAAGTVSFSARKVFTNGTLKAHPFKIRLTYVTGENDDTPVDNNGVPVYQQEVTVDDDAESQTVNFTDVPGFIKNKTQDDTQNTYWFLIEEIDDNADKTDIGYDAVAQRWISVTLTDNGHGGLDVTKSPAPAKEGGVDLDAVFTNEQLGGVQVTKAFSGHAAPAGFMITAEYQLAGQSKTTLQLTTDGANGTQAPSSGTGAADDPWVWQIGGLPVGTEVTFTESGITVNDGYSVTATFTDAAGQQSTGTSGTVTADEQNQGNYPAGAFVNTYTRDTGSLKIKKTVQVNGAAPAAADCALVDGTYTFTVTGKGLAAGTDDKIVTVTIENGAVTGGTVADSTDPNNTTPIAPDADGYLVISGLPTGDYEITETITPEMTGKGIVLKEPAGNKVTVTVEANNTADIPAADFTNEKEIGGLEISKTVNGTTDNTKLFTFEVTLTAPATGATLDSSYPAVKTTGTGAGAATENVTVNVDGSGKVTIDGANVKLTAGQTLTISELPKGTTYTVKEINI